VAAPDIFDPDAQRPAFAAASASASILEFRTASRIRIAADYAAVRGLRPSAALAVLNC
jgi:hypothetical protein